MRKSPHFAGKPWLALTAEKVQIMTVAGSPCGFHQNMDDALEIRTCSFARSRDLTGNQVKDAAV
jgi:hypothetical protein